MSSSNHQTVVRPLEPWHELKDKVILLTGASSGIGREICLDLAKSGCKIIAAARRLDRLQSLCSEINKTGTKLAAPLELDVSSDAATIQNAVEQAWRIFGNIDVLINNAGVRGNVKSSLDLHEEEWERVFRTNLTGPWLVSKHVCLLMRDAKRGGSVINVSSIAGLQRGKLPGALAYACSKGGLDIMTKMMAVELGKYDIRVNSIAPGLFKSEITEGLLRKEWMKGVTERIIPLKVLQSVDPGITSLVRYLIHDSSRYVSGNVYIVDAGATLTGLPIFSSL
ncbi:NAD(P)-binding Rossmann-fold superfamily protein [Hirschfeldia incana]|nr:NAD(P)-binding Rossmann-fold superfamily protein [Hirschfeldia incana]